MTLRLVFCALSAITSQAATQRVGAPPAIPVFKLPPPDAVTKELIGIPAGLRQFADGRLVVNDGLKQRLVVFDKTLSKFTVTADSSGTGARLYPRSFSASSIYYYLGDSAMFPDLSNPMSAAFIMIDPDGTFGRAVAHPRPSDLQSVGQSSGGAFDPQGRFIYQAPLRLQLPPMPGQARPPRNTIDTVAILRADFETRRIDTIAHITRPALTVPSQVTWDSRGHGSATVVINPLPVAPDAWAVLSDGSLAVVRSHDYHIDWVYADGTAASTPRMSFDWRRLTDEDKRARVDSLMHVIDSLRATPHPYMEMAARRTPQAKMEPVIPTIHFVPYSEMLDYVAPIRAGSVQADRDNHLWILPTTTLSATGGGLLYDVIDKQGKIFERVQLPPDRTIAGFGPGGVIYLVHGSRDKGFTIERTRIAP